MNHWQHICNKKQKNIIYLLWSNNEFLWQEKFSYWELFIWAHIHDALEHTHTHTKEEKRKGMERKWDRKYRMVVWLCIHAKGKHICRYLQLFEKWIDLTETARNQIAKWMLIESISHLNDDAITDKWYSYRTQCLGNHKK